MATGNLVKTFGSKIGVMDVSGLENVSGVSRCGGDFYPATEAPIPAAEQVRQGQAGQDIPIDANNHAEDTGESKRSNLFFSLRRNIIVLYCMDFPFIENPPKRRQDREICLWGVWL